MTRNSEQNRLDQNRKGLEPWRLWGAYLSDRQWGTVREDYSPHGSAWDYFPHDHARSRAYRWGEDGIAGFCDDQQRLCLSLALWNGRDPILKERLFGLAGPEGNHGEDVKELYYHLDATPTQSYMRMLYKYPQAEFPYAKLVEENRRRGKDQREFELLDTGIFEDDRYFDVSIEYAKAGPHDVLMRITAHNAGPEAAALHLLPQLWFRNTWSWGDKTVKPRLERENSHAIAATHETLGRYTLYFEGRPQLLFTENQTNALRLFGSPNASPYVKDAFHQRVILNHEEAVNPKQIGTKAALWHQVEIAPHSNVTLRLRLVRGETRQALKDFDSVMRQRQTEADEFFAAAQSDLQDAEARRVQRQAWAGLIWSRQYFGWDVARWHAGDPGQPAPDPRRHHGRNADWTHLNNAQVLTMPDKWEYPYYCAWDTAFQCVPLARIDPDWAKHELLLLTREWYMHPNGQLPAYEWALGDVNPPVHGWAAWQVYEIDRQRTGRPDRDFLERIFHKLLLNFTWWVNRKDMEGRNVFQGGFLGMDNVGVFDRSAALPTGGFINQADGTSWMAMYCLNMMRIALELASDNPVYEDTATKFFEHFLYIAAAMNHVGACEGCPGVSLWDEEDQFFYDVLCLPHGERLPLKVRSMVGLTPLFAVEVLDEELLATVPNFRARLEWFLNYRPDLASLVSRWNEPGKGQTHLLSLLRGHRMKRLLARMLDESEFLSPHGVRSISRFHRDQPYELHVNGSTFTVKYLPGESDSGLFGGNSNWRGPIWMPMNFMLVNALRQFHRYYGEDFKIPCPTGSHRLVSIRQAADEVARRLSSLFLKDAQGRRPVLGYHPKLQDDPRFSDALLFHEYFDGDTGRGVGASHQTGWSSLVAALIQNQEHPTRSTTPALAEAAR